MPSASTGNAILIPNNCVYYKSGDAYVYTYDNGIIHEVPVEVVSMTVKYRGAFRITLDDQILTTWTSELREGPKVTLEIEAPANPLRDEWNGKPMPDKDAGHPETDQTRQS